MPPAFGFEQKPYHFAPLDTQPLIVARCLNSTAPGAARDRSVPDAPASALARTLFELSKDDGTDEIEAELGPAFTGLSTVESWRAAEAALEHVHRTLREEGPRQALALFDRSALRKSPLTLVHYYRAEILAMLGRHEEATAFCQKALERNPDFAPALRLGAWLHLEQGRGAEALDAAWRVMELDPTDSAALTIAGRAHRQLGEFGEAERSLRLALEQAPYFPRAQFALGELLLDELDRPAEALAVAAPIRFGYAPGHRTHVEIQHRAAAKGLVALTVRAAVALGDVARALEILDAARSESIKTEPKGRWRAWFHYATVMADAGEQALAAACFAEILKHPTEDNGAGWRFIGHRLWDARQWALALEAYERALELDPGHALALERLGNCLAKLDRLEEAMALVDDAIAYAPGSSALHRIRGNLFLDYTEDQQEALDAYERALELDSRNDLAWANSGLALERLGRHEDARAAYERALEFDPDDIWSLVRLGRLLHGELDRTAEAELLLKKATRIAPKDKRGFKWLGDLLTDERRDAEAIPVLERALELAPSDIFVRADLALAYDRQERHEEAREAYERRLELAPESVWGLVMFGRLLHADLDQTPRAEALFRKAIEVAPTDKRGFKWLGDLLSDEDRFDEAIPVLEKGLEIDPDDGGMWRDLGTCLHYGKKDLAAAERTYRRAIECDPEDEVLWYPLALCLNDLRRPEEALAVLDKCIELAPDYALAWLRRGIILRDELERYEQSEKAIRRRIELKSLCAWSWEELGVTLTRMGRYDEALDALDFASTLGPHEASIWGHRGVVLLGGLDRPGDAEASFRRALQLEPDSEVALSSLAASFLERGDPGAALAVFRRCLLARPESAYCHAGYARILHEELGRPDEAVRSYETALRIDPSLSESWIGLAQAHEARGDHAAVISAYERGASQVHDPHPLLLMRAIHEREHGELERAIEICKEAQAARPQDWIAATLLAQFFLEAEDETSARRVAEESERWAGQKLRNWLTLAELYRVNFEDGDAAVRCARRAVELGPTSGDAWYSLATALEAAGLFEEQRAAVERLAAIAEESADAASKNNAAWVMATELPSPSRAELLRALALAQGSCALTRRQNADFLDTLAEIHFRLGNRAEALRVIDEALALPDANTEYLKEQRARFAGSEPPKTQ